MSTEVDTLTPVEETPVDEKAGSTALRVIGWFSVGMAVAALGIFVGAELRSRYQLQEAHPLRLLLERRRAAGGRIRRRHLAPARQICLTRCRLRAASLRLDRTPRFILHSRPRIRASYRFPVPCFLFPSVPAGVPIERPLLDGVLVPCLFHFAPISRMRAVKARP